MKILHGYVLKEHAGPLGFSLGALTALVFLNYVAKRFGDLAGKGLPWSVIGEFFALAIPFIVAMTLPMAVLVATLYAFSRLASDNEITALRASGVGTRRIMAPVIAAAGVVTLLMVLFNDQVMPRSNHQLAVLQRDIAQKKPTFALREQVINEISPGKLYLRAGHLEQSSNRMREIVIYDFADPARRRTIFADSGDLAMSTDLADLIMTLFEGTLQDVPTDKPEQLQRLFFRTDRVRVKGVGNEFRKTEAQTYKGEREMTVCEMAGAETRAQSEYAAAVHEFRERVQHARRLGAKLRPDLQRLPDEVGARRTIGTMYCSGIRAIARALSRAAASLGGGAAPRVAFAQAAPRAADRVTPVRPPLVAPRTDTLPASLAGSTASALMPAIEAARIRMNESERVLGLYGVEIHKKFALAVACLVFVLLGAPIALRFPRGGVGLVIGVSIGVFGLYYVALIGGQSLGVRGLVPPAIAMWGANVLFASIGIALLMRIGREGVTARGGDAREMLDAVRAWTAQQLTRVGVRMERRRRYE